MFTNKKEIRRLEAEKKILADGLAFQLSEKTRLEEELKLLKGDNHKKAANLLRHELGLTKMRFDFTPQRPNEEDVHHYFYGKTQEQIKQFMGDALNLFENPTFKPVIKYLVDTQGNHSLLGSRGREEDLVGRGEISGFARVFHEYMALAEAHKQMNQPEKKYDKSEILAEQQ